MCGFVGIVGLNKSFSPEQIRQSLSAIRHRGPDDMGVWQNKEGTISFGHARLSIIDVSGGHQPLTNADDTLVAVVNGEFYDYERIRKELEAEGYRFKTNTDSEILIALYERDGVRCLRHLRGEFAFVLYDQRNQWVVAARDRFGIKPLFYKIENHTIYFASEVKALKPLGLNLNWDEDSFYQALHLLPLPDRTLFKDVCQIEPGHYLVKSLYNPTPHLNCYWDFNYPRATDRKAIVDEQEAVEEFRRLFSEAISLRLRADVPVAAYLSGGLDSCAILGLAQTLSSKPIQAFTLTFTMDDYNELAQAEEMAKFAKAPFQAVPITPSKIAQGMEDAVWHAERFFINGHGIAKYFLSEAVHKAGVKVVLTGEGSDEIFAGYAHFRQDQIMHGTEVDPTKRAAMLAQLMKSNKVSQGILLSSQVQADVYSCRQQLGYVPGWVQGYSHQRGFIAPLLSDEIIAKIGSRNPFYYLLNTLDIDGQVLGREKLDQSLYLWSKTSLPYYLLTVLGDRMEMAHSVEGRVPFLDHHLVEYVVQLPPSLKIKNMTEKYLLREAAKPFVTRTIYERQKHPFLAPPALADKSDPQLSQLLQDTLRSNHLKDIPFLSQTKVIKMLDEVSQGSPDQKIGADVTLMALASAAMIQKRFGLSG